MICNDSCNGPVVPIGQAYGVPRNPGRWAIGFWRQGLGHPGPAYRLELNIMQKNYYAMKKYEFTR